MLRSVRTCSSCFTQKLYTLSGRHIGDVAKVALALATLASGANVSVRWLANVLIATTARFNEGLTLWCPCALCLIKCCLYCLFNSPLKSKEAVLC